MKKLLSLAVSAAVLWAIYARIDGLALVGSLRGSDPVWLGLGVALVLPLTALTAWRLLVLVPRPGALGVGAAAGLVLAASSLNMVLPSKMGDLAKAVFLKDQGGLGGARSLSLVVFEKSCDMLSLLLWCVLGLVLLPDRTVLHGLLALGVVTGLAAGLILLGSRRAADGVFALARRVPWGRLRDRAGRLQEGWFQMREYFWEDRARLAGICALSALLWFLHLVQIWFFTRALHTEVPFLANLGLAPLAILAGLLPLTFAGVGTRDAALILFYRAYLTPAQGAALGLLCLLRYLLPAFGGLPFLGRYLGEARGLKRAP